MKQEAWEIDCTTNFDEAKKLAQDGWELVSVTEVIYRDDDNSQDSVTTWHFKRKK